MARGQGQLRLEKRAGMKKIQSIAVARWMGLILGPALAFAQPASVGAGCGSVPPAAFCAAVRGARAEGWPSQSRSEVMAQHGMVVASQPLAAQVGLQTLQDGGNTSDAAVGPSRRRTVTG